MDITQAWEEKAEERKRRTGSRKKRTGSRKRRTGSRKRRKRKRRGGSNASKMRVEKRNNKEGG